jgi:GxxExxY protein
LEKFGFSVTKQLPISVFYEGKEVGSYYADLVVDNLVIIEIKACDGCIEEPEAQLTNYLRATRIEVGLLLNFGVKPQVKRSAFSNDYKQF